MELTSSIKTKNFQALHDGIGFHPFSDGMPYAPIKKDSSSISQSQPTLPFTTIEAPLLSTAPVSALSAGPHFFNRDVKATRRMRFLAFSLDCIIHALFWATVSLGIAFIFDLHFGVLIDQFFEIPFILFYLFSQWTFIALQKRLFKTTLGKTFFNLQTHQL